MANVIELPGDANPLTAESLISTLSAGVGASPQHRQVATKQLDTWSTQQLYYDGLAHVFADKSRPSELRTLAIILIKNGVDKHWRKGSKSTIRSPEKETIKSKVLDATLSEPESRLAGQSVVVLARIARYEFPVDWPTALSVDLLRPLPRHSLQFTRALEIYCRIIKEMASIRVPRVKTQFRSVAPELLGFLQEAYSVMVTEWMSGQKTPELAREIVLLLKNIRHLLTGGFEHPHREHIVHSLWTQANLTVFGTWPPWQTDFDQVGSEIYYQLGKLHLQLAESHPASFVLLPNFADILNQHWTLSIGQLGEYWSMTTAHSLEDISADHAAHREPWIAKIGLKSLLLFRTCAKMAFNPVHTFTSHIEAERKERDEAVKILRSLVFTSEFALPIAQYLMVHFFSIRKVDLSDWQDDPDGWDQKMYGDSDAWEYSVRGCSEKLFLDLVINFREAFVPQLVEVFNGVADGTTQDIFRKESILCAIGLAASVLHDKLNFNIYLERSLLPEVTKQEPGSNILRHRIAILLGQWVPVLTEGLNRKAVYLIFRQILDPGDPMNDQVVRVAAGMQLKNVIEPFEFEVKDFVDDAAPILHFILQLLHQSATVEVRMGLLNTVRVITAKMGIDISPHASYLLQDISKLWDDQDLLINETIVSILSTLVTSLGENSVNYFQYLLPLMSNVLMTNELREYLLTETLDLLGSILVQIPDNNQIDPKPLIDLITTLSDILDLGDETVRQALEILSSYSLLVPLQCLQPSRSESYIALCLQSFQALEFRILEEATTMINQFNATLASNTLRLIERLILAEQIHKQPLAGSGVQPLIKRMIDTRFLPTLVSGIREAHLARQATGPYRPKTHIYGVVETEYVVIFSRLILADLTTFAAALHHLSTDPSYHLPPDIPSILILETLSHFDAIGDLSRKKLTALALTHTLTSQTQAAPLGDTLRDHFQELLSIWTDIITDLTTSMADPDPDPDLSDPSSAPTTSTVRPDRPLDSLVTNFNALPAPSPGTTTPEYFRQRRFETEDPVFVVDLPAFVRDQFLEFVDLCGGQDAFTRLVLDNVDREVVEAFRALGLF